MQVTPDVTGGRFMSEILSAGRVELPIITLIMGNPTHNKSDKSWWQWECGSISPSRIHSLVQRQRPELLVVALCFYEPDPGNCCCMAAAKSSDRDLQ